MDKLILVNLQDKIVIQLGVAKCIAWDSAMRQVFEILRVDSNDYSVLVPTDELEYASVLGKFNPGDTGYLKVDVGVDEITSGHYTIEGSGVFSIRDATPLRRDAILSFNRKDKSAFKVILEVLERGDVVLCETPKSSGEVGVRSFSGGSICIHGAGHDDRPLSTLTDCHMTCRLTSIRVGNRCDAKFTLSARLY